MANFVSKAHIAFATSATSAEVKIDPRDVIVGLTTDATFVGVSLEIHYSFDEGVTWIPVFDTLGTTQLAKITDANLPNGVGYAVFGEEWGLTNRFKLVSSSAVEVGNVIILTKTRK